MKNHKEIFSNYYSETPLSLAMERMQEVMVFQNVTLVSPVLDVGCGDGIFASNTFVRKIDYGIDILDFEIKRASERQCYEHLFMTDASSTNFESNKFNTVISNSVMEHMENLSGVLKEIYRVLNPTGTLHITIPNENFEKSSLVYTALQKLKMQGAANLFAKAYNEFWNHKNVFSNQGWVNFLSENGFEVIDSFSYNSRRQAMINDILAWLAFVGYLNKLAFNRWTILPKFRKKFSNIIYPIIRSQSTLNISDSGALTYFLLKKK